MEKITVRLSNSAKRIYNLQDNKTQFLNDLIINFIKNSNSEMSEISNLNKNLETIISAQENLKSEIQNLRKDFLNIIFIAASDAKQKLIEDYIKTTEDKL
jgi:molecular chaperone GrpE (heat shock protein)